VPGGRPDDPGVWLLDMEVGGHVYRYATEAVDVTDVQDRTFHYLEGLSEPGLSFGSVLGSEGASAALEIVAAVDWPLIVQRGHNLDRCPAVLRRWYSGRVLERAAVVIRGLTEGATYGAQHEPLTISIVRSMSAQTRTIPPAQAVIDTSTWPVTASYTSPDRIQGAALPMVIGCPGTQASGNPVCVVPCPQAEIRSGVGEGRIVWLGGDATTVRVRIKSDDPPTESDETVGSAFTDLLGRTVSHCPSNENNPEGEYLVGFSSTNGGGITYQAELLRGAGGILEWVLREHYAGLVDLGRVAAVRTFLDAYKIDTYINSPVSAWDWLTSEVLPLLPVEMREGSRGIYPALIRYNLTERDAVAHIDATSGSGRVDRASPVSTLADIVNEITVEYQPDGESGSAWLARRIVTAQASYVSGNDASDTADARVVGSAICAASQRRYGVRPFRMQAGAVWDTATAIRIAEDVAARRAWPRRTVRYTGGPWLEDIAIGQAVTLTDPDLHLSRAVAVVGDVFPEASGASVDLILLDDPLRRDRSTS
jgi:hypothetical protein